MLTKLGLDRSSREYVYVDSVGAVPSLPKFAHTRKTSFVRIKHMGGERGERARERRGEGGESKRRGREGERKGREKKRGKGERRESAGRGEPCQLKISLIRVVMVKLLARIYFGGRSSTELITNPSMWSI